MEGGKSSGHQLTGEKLWLLRGGVVAIAIVIAVVALIVSGGEDEGPPTLPEAGSRIVSEGELAEAAAALGQPIYWAGPINGADLELEELPEGEGARVRYVPEGSAAGEAPTNVLTIGSYEVGNAVTALENFAAEPGATSRQGQSGLEVFVNEERPTSVYFADPEGAVQVEVYDPAAKMAMSLALSGKVEPAE
jgi:hypothetical protein